MIGVGHFPEHRIATAGSDAARVPEGNVAVVLAMDQKNWNGGGDRIFWRDLLQVEPVLPADVEERELDDGAEQRASEPRAKAEGLAHAVVGNLAEAGERRFGSDGAEAWLNREGLQEFGGAHGFAESKDAVWVSLCGNELKPLVNVVAFQQAVGGELAPA